MNEADVMMVMDTMAQMFETLVKRIEDLAREVDELRLERKKWINDLHPGAVIPQYGDMLLSQDDVNRILSEGSE